MNTYQVFLEVDAGVISAFGCEFVGIGNVGQADEAIRFRIDDDSTLVIFTQECLAAFVDNDGNPLDSELTSCNAWKIVHAFTLKEFSVKEFFNFVRSAA